MKLTEDAFPSVPPPAICPDCGQGLTDHAMLCARRAIPIPEAGSASAAAGIDKREATVLHCDVDAAVRVGHSVDLESYHEYVQAVLECIRGAVRQHRPQGDPSYDRATGNSVLFCFGLPVASEDDAINAVSAALSAVASISALAVPDGVRPELRIGVATGSVVFALRAGRDDIPPQEVTGVAPNLAARLQSVRPGGTVLICETTQAIVSRRFLCEALGTFDLKGLGARRAWLVRDRRLPPPVSEARLVGRTRELAAMITRWREACNGAAGALLVRGEPGIGKSRLLHEFRTRIAGDDILVMDVRCSRAHRDTSFYAIADHLERTFRLPPAGPNGAREARLSEVFVHRFGLPPGDLPQVAGFLTPAGFDAGTTSAAEAKARRDDAMRSMIDLLHHRVRAHRAAVAFIEDVQWADASSFEFLCRILREAEKLNLLFVFSARPEFDPRHLEGVPVERIDLDPLTDAQSAILVGNIDTRCVLPPSVVELAVSKCDGIPLYVTELTRSLLDRISGDATDDRREAELLDAIHDVPKTLRGLLNARLDRSHAARNVAQVAAVIGREFPLDLLSAVASMSPEQLGRGLEELEEADLIAELSSETGKVYVFRHALFQDVAYDSLLDTPRRELHARIADALAREGSSLPPAPPAVVAQHFTEARLHRAAIHHWVRASHHAAERSDNVEAAGHLNQAIELAAALDDPGEAADLELELRARLVPPLLAAHGYASEHVARNTARATALFPVARSAEPKIVILRTDCNWAIVRAEYTRASGFAAEIARLAAHTKESGLTLDALLLSGLVALYQGRLEIARENLDDCLALYDASIHSKYSIRQGVDIASAAHAYLSRALWLLGDAHRAEQAAMEAEERAVQSRIPLAETQAQGMKMLLHLAAGDVPKVRTSANRTMELAQRRGQLYWVCLVSVVSAWLDSLSAATPEALLAVDRSLHAYRGTGSRLGLSWLLLLRADVEHRVHLPGRAQATLEEALDFVRESDERYYLPEIYRVHAKLLWHARGQRDRARAMLDRALDVATEQGAVAWRVKTAATCANLRLAEAGTAHALSSSYSLIAP